MSFAVRSARCAGCSYSGAFRGCLLSEFGIASRQNFLMQMLAHLVHLFLDQMHAAVGTMMMHDTGMQVPLTAVLLLFELTHDYSIILPTLGAVGLAYWIASLPTTARALQEVNSILQSMLHQAPTCVTAVAPWPATAHADLLSQTDSQRELQRMQTLHSSQPRAPEMYGNVGLHERLLSGTCDHFILLHWSEDSFDPV